MGFVHEISLRLFSTCVLSRQNVWRFFDVLLRQQLRSRSKTLGLTAESSTDCFWPWLFFSFLKGWQVAKFTALSFSIEFLSGLPECKGASSGLAIGEGLDRSPTPVGPWIVQRNDRSLFFFYYKKGSCRGPRIHLRFAGGKKTCPDFFGN